MPRRDKALQRATAVIVEQMEVRVLMSVSVSKGVLEIEGSRRDDIIVVAPVEGGLSVALNGDLTTVKAEDVKQIRIESGRGADSITLLEMGGTITTPAYISAGRDNDTVVGGSGNDTILGGRGDDQLVGATGTNKIDDEAYASNGTMKAMAVSSGSRAPAALGIPSYIVSDLGTLPNGLGAGDRIPYNINNLVTPNTTGYAFVVDPAGYKTPHGFLKAGTGGRTTDVGTLGGGTSGSTSIGWDLNDNNEVVGQSQAFVNGPTRAFHWVNGAMRDLGALGGGTGGTTIAWGINNLSNIVGESNGQAVFRTGPGAVWRTIPSADGQSRMSGRLREIGDSDIGPPVPFPDGIGDVMVGYDSTNLQGFWYNELTNTSTDMGLIAGTTVSEAYDVNDMGVGGFTAVGVSYIPQQGTVIRPVERAFYYRGAQMVALPTAANYQSMAWGVNNPTAGLVKIVGRITTRNNNTVVNHASMWAETAADTFQLIDLQTLTSGGTGRVLEEAHAINDADWVVAFGTVVGDSAKHAFILRPGPPGGIAGYPNEFTSTFVQPLPNGGAIGGLNFNIYGVGTHTVTPTTVDLTFVSVDLMRNRLPSQGTVDFTFDNPLRRYVTSVSKGTGKFSGIGEAFVTAADGSFADMLVRFEGTTFRKNKKDFVQGTFVAVSRRGVPLKQGRQFIYSGSFGPK